MSTSLGVQFAAIPARWHMSSAVPMTASPRLPCVSTSVDTSVVLGKMLVSLLMASRPKSMARTQHSASQNDDGPANGIGHHSGRIGHTSTHKQVTCHRRKHADVHHGWGGRAWRH